MGISAIIITKNEEKNLYDCLSSINFVDEIIIVDSASNDKTLEIAKQFNAIINTPEDWSGFGVQKNRALALASHEWVLSIDADERISEELKLEIINVIKNPQARCYKIPRKSWYCGKFIKYCGWSPDFVLRLFMRGSAQFSNDLVHEQVKTDEKVIELKSPIIHYSFNDFSQVLNKVDKYSTAGAQQAFNNGKKSSLSKAIVRGVWAFVRTYILKLGFLDGAHGFAIAVSNAEGTYYRYMKLWYMQKIKND